VNWKISNMKNVELPDGNIAEFPDDMTNKEISEVIRRKFPNNNYGVKGILSDIGKSISNTPEAILESFKNLPSQILSSGKQIYNDPERALKNLLVGGGEGLKGIYNAIPDINNYLARKKISDFKENYIPKIGDLGIAKRILGNPQEGDELLQNIASFAPYGIAGGIKKGLEGSLRRAGTTGYYAAGQNEDPLQAALMGLGLEEATKGIQKGKKISNFRPSSYIKSPLTDTELKEALDITKGTETDLGNVIKNPFIQKQFENYLSELPFSGGTQAMERTANEINRRGQTALERFKGQGDISDIGFSLNNKLKSLANEVRNLKNEKFTALNEAASEEGITTDRSNMIRVAKETLKKIKSDRHLEKFTDSTAKDILTHIASEKIPQKTKENFSLENTDLLRGAIGEKIRETYRTGNEGLRNLLTPLKNAINKDLHEAVETSNNPHIKKLRDEAFKYYEKEYVPFKDPDIQKFTLQGADPDTLVSTFLKKSQLSDRGRLLEKLTSKLPEDQKRLLAYSYFSKAIKNDEFNPTKFKNLYQNIGDSQKKALLSEDEIKYLNNYIKLIDKNNRALYLMHNPKTGYGNIAWKSILGGAATGGHLGGIPGAILGGISPGIVAKPVVKYLTNPKKREKIIENMIKSRERNRNKKSLLNISPFVQILNQVSSNQNND